MFTDSSKQLAKFKLLLLYIIHHIGSPVSNIQLTQFVLENDIMDYFMLQQFLSELKDSKFIIEEFKDKEHIFTITNMVKNTLNYFTDHIPESKIEHVNKLLNIRKEKLILNAQITADYIKLKNNEYLARLKATEKDLPIINLELNVVNNRQAKQICEKWLENAPSFYNRIINMLIE